MTAFHIYHSHSARGHRDNPFCQHIHLDNELDKDCEEVYIAMPNMLVRHYQHHRHELQMDATMLPDYYKRHAGQ